MAIDTTAAGRMLVEKFNKFVDEGKRGFDHKDPEPTDAAAMLLTVDEPLDDWDRELLRIFTRQTEIESLSA